jgi:hypothetical protein
VNLTLLCVTPYTGPNLHSVPYRSKLYCITASLCDLYWSTYRLTIITIEVHITVCLCDLQSSPYRFLLQYVYVTKNYHQTGSYYSMSMWLIIIIKHVHITVFLCDYDYHHTGSYCSMSMQLTITTVSYYSIQYSPKRFIQQYVYVTNNYYSASI